MSFRSIDEFEGAFEKAMQRIEERLTALETRSVRLGNYYVKQDVSGNLIVEHVTTHTVTIIATP